MWTEEISKKRRNMEADKGNVQMKKDYEKSYKKFQTLLKKQEQLLRGTVL